jgi:ribosome biogenesis protein UTP30
MSPPQPPHTVPRETVASAVASLAKWMKKRAAEARPNLLADERDDLVVLQLSLRRVPASRSTRPRLLPLPHPVVGHDGASVCVISDDRPKSRSPAASDLLHASKSLHRLPVSEVIPLSTLRTDYRPYESRRRLAASHDLFVADRAILPLLPRVLGKAFYSTKKAPIGVDFTRVGWPEQVRKVLGSAFLYLRSGTCSGIKVGRLDMEEEEIVDNVMAAVEAAVEKVPKKWANVRALHLKAVDSVALPIYQVVPELGMKIEVPENVGSGEVIDAAEADTRGKKIDKKKANAGASGRVIFGNISAKRKRNKKEQIEEDVVMQEEVQVETEKKKRKSTAVSADDSQKVDKKNKEKGKRGLENEVKEASLDNKKIKKGKTEEGKKKKSMKGDGEVGTDEIQEDKKIKGEKSDGKTKKLRTRVRV